jgi:hypothetical protein
MKFYEFFILFIINFLAVCLAILVSFFIMGTYSDFNRRFRVCYKVRRFLRLERDIDPLIPVPMPVWNDNDDIPLGEP